MMEWEPLTLNAHRMKVYGGWLVLHESSGVHYGEFKSNMVRSESMTFVPDFYHAWKLEG